MGVFGNAAIYQEFIEPASLSTAINNDITISLFIFLEQFPFSQVIMWLAIVIILTFFVTSSDSGSLVIDILTAGGHQDPPKNQRVFWAISEGVIASILIYAGGLKALQTAAIASGLPFALIMLGMCFALFKELKNENLVVKKIR